MSYGTAVSTEPAHSKTWQCGLFLLLSNASLATMLLTVLNLAMTPHCCRAGDQGSAQPPLPHGPGLPASLALPLLMPDHRSSPPGLCTDCSICWALPSHLISSSHPSDRGSGSSPWRTSLAFQCSLAVTALSHCSLPLCFKPPCHGSST